MLGRSEKWSHDAKAPGCSTLRKASSRSSRMLAGGAQRLAFVASCFRGALPKNDLTACSLGFFVDISSRSVARAAARARMAAQKCGV